MRLLRDPLVRFFLIGALLLVAYSAASGWFSRDDRRVVTIDEAQVALLAGNFERTWRRLPTEEELRGLISARVREEVLYREALALGLDADDIVVRRRMVQKMELLTQDLALMTDPTEEELRAFFEENRDDYRTPERMTFRQLFFSTDRRGDQARADAAALFDGITAGSVDPSALTEEGDPSLLAPDYREVTEADVSRSFGSGFATSLFELDEGWHGPLASPFGFHLVRITRRDAGADAVFDNVRPAVVRDFNRERGEQAKAGMYARLLDAYEITIDEAALVGTREPRR
jgi:hypothetical protein